MPKSVFPVERQVNFDTAFFQYRPENTAANRTIDSIIKIVHQQSATDTRSNVVDTKLQVWQALPTSLEGCDYQRLPGVANAHPVLERRGVNARVTGDKTVPVQTIKQGDIGVQFETGQINTLVV